MLKIEYLIFIDNNNIKCNDEKSFNHLLQSDPEIQIENKNISYKEITVEYGLTFGQIADTDRTYFHLSFENNNIDNIETYVSLMKAVKTIIHIITQSPQTLFDGVSIHYSNLAYPIISDIENLMRKLITKFMLTKVGIDWVKDRTPDDVKTSINSKNKDLTYLHNVDFIQLKNFLFSENYPIHKENLIKKLKDAKNISDLDLDDIKVLIPNSNWERYFSTNISISKEKLIKNWDELYDLRCKIAHNKAFNKSDFEKVDLICKEIKPQLEQAIQSLSDIKIDESTRDILTEEIANNFNVLYGEFISKWRSIENYVFNNLIGHEAEDVTSVGRLFYKDLKRLRDFGLIDGLTYYKIFNLYKIKNQILHNSNELSEIEVYNAVTDLNILLYQLGINNQN